MTDTVPVPTRLARRPRDHRGFVVPYFVATINGEPDFRVIEPSVMADCVNNNRCWLCGDKMGVHLAFVLGPMCTINKLISEPPSHKECAEYALKVCPFLTRPRMRRNEKGLPDQYVEAAGFHNDRNPGIMALWITRSYQPFRPHAGRDGVLFRVGPYERVEWWKEGRRATRDEAVAALVEGYDVLAVEAAKEGALDELRSLMPAAMRTVPS